MPLILLPFIGGLVVGSGAVYVASDTAKTVVNIGLIVGGAYYLHKKGII